MSVDAPSLDLNLDGALHRLKLNRADETAWGTLYDLLVPRTRALAYRLGRGDFGLVEDSVQDALEKLIRYVDFTKLASADDLIRYFSTVVRRSTLDALSKRGLAAEFVQPTDDSEEESPSNDSDETPEDQLAYRQALDSLHAALGTRERIVLTLLMRGYDRREISARLGLSAPSVSVLIHRLRNRVRDITTLP